MARTAEYEHHDFGAVNTYVDSVSGAVRERSRAARAGRFTTYAKYTALVLVALGVLSLLFMWGLSLLRDPKIVTDTRIVEKPVSFQPNIYITDPSAVDAVRAGAARRVGEAAEATGAPAQIFNYVIFRDIPFGESGLGNVTVGMRYKRTEDRLPSRQWCYVERETTALDAHTEQIYLATKEGDQVSRASLTDEHARRMSAPLDTLRAAQGLCRFM